MLKEVCRPTDAPSQANSMLQLAAERLAYPQYTKGVVYKTRVLSCDPSMPPNASLLQSLERSDAATVTPVKIDVMDTDVFTKTTCNGSSNNNPNIESSIIIYNCGITSFLYAQCHVIGSPNYHALLMNAYKFFNLSAQVATSLPQPDDEVTTASHLVMAFLAVRGLLHVVPLAAGSDEDNERLAMQDCNNIDYYARLHDDIYHELCVWQSGTNLWMLLMDPKLAAMA